MLLQGVNVCFKSLVRLRLVHCFARAYLSWNIPDLQEEIYFFGKMGFWSWRLSPYHENDEICDGFCGGPSDAWCYMHVTSNTEISSLFVLPVQKYPSIHIHRVIYFIQLCYWKIDSWRLSPYHRRRILWKLWWTLWWTIWWHMLLWHPLPRHWRLLRRQDWFMWEVRTCFRIRFWSVSRSYYN